VPAHGPFLTKIKKKLLVKLIFGISYKLTFHNPSMCFAEQQCGPEIAASHEKCSFGWQRSSQMKLLQ
jgi:hypothetical protein